MTHEYYVFHVQLTDESSVRVQKLGPGNEPYGEPSGVLRYRGVADLLDELLRKARAAELDDSSIKTFGEALFGVMFDDVLAQDFFDFYERARAASQRVRVEIDINEFELPQLASLPWELTRVPSEMRHGALVFATDPGVTLVRHRARREPPRDIRLAPGEPLRIAVAAVAPLSSEELQLGPVQYQQVYDDLRSLANRFNDRIQLLDLVENATAGDIDNLLKKRPHVFHFIGHGRLRGIDGADVGEIILSDGILNYPDPYQAAEFGELFSRHLPAVVLLHACEGAAVSTADAFAGVASQLIEQGLPVVVAMQFEIANYTARRFANEFYFCLVQGKYADEAVQEARRVVSLDGSVRHRTRNFATPVIFTRVRDSRLLDLEAAGSGSGANSSLSLGLKRYLTWVNDRFGQVELRGIRLDGNQVLQLDLDKIYVPLEATAYVRREGRQARSEGPQTWDIDMAEMLRIGNHVILTGGPGSGKTTVLLHIVHTLAEALLTDSPALAHEKLGLEGDLPLPVFVPLSAYSAYLKSLDANANLATGEQFTLTVFISHYLKQQQIGAELPANFFEQAFLTGSGVMLLLDGLDEVPNESERVRVRQAIENLIIGRPGMRVVITCRTAAHRGRTALGRDFREVRVKPLDWNYTIKLVEQAYGHIYEGQEELGTEKAVEILQAIASLEIERQRRLGPGTPLLINSPLLLRLLFIVHHNNYGLPAKRSELYLLATNAMLLPDYGPDEEVSETIGALVGGNRDLQLELVKHIAFHLHIQGGGTQEGREIDEYSLRELLAARPEFAGVIDDFISLTRLRGTLLEERLGQYRFIHLAFQEFLVGRYLAENILGKYGLPQLIKLLESGPLIDTWWREPVLLVAGFLSITSPRWAAALLWYLIGSDEQEESASDDLLTMRVSAVELAATALMEWDEAPDELRLAVRKRLAGLFADARRPALARVRPRVRASAGVALGVFGDDRPSVLDADRMEFCAVPQGPAYLGSDHVEIADDDRERLQSLVSEQGMHVLDVDYDYWLARFPVTNAQYRPFIEDGGYEQESFWAEARANSSWRPGEIHRYYWQGQNLQLSWENGPYNYGLPYNLPNHPVVGISWYEALAYMRWLTQRWREKRLLSGDWTLCFPSELEWEKAARGGVQLSGEVLLATIADLGSAAMNPAAQVNPGAKRSYPWLGDVDVNRSNSLDAGIGTTSVVGCFPEGISPYGCEEMTGGVWEWTRTLWGRQRATQEAGDISFDIEFKYPYSPADGREDLRPDSYWLRVARGGAHNAEVRYCRCSFRDMGAPNFRFPWDGFRIAILPTQVVSRNTAVPALRGRELCSAPELAIDCRWMQRGPDLRIWPSGTRSLFYISCQLAYPITARQLCPRVPARTCDTRMIRIASCPVCQDTQNTASTTDA